jgi:outer membrane protein TolC
MRYLLFILLSCAGCSAFAQEPVVAARALTLRECVERALASNLDISIERINPQIQNWGVVSAESAFEPALQGSALFADDSSPTATGTVITRQWEFDAGLVGKLPSGTQYKLTGLDTRADGTLYSEAVHTGSGAVTLTQPLLKNFWFGPNLAPVRVARKQRKMADEAFALLVMNTISDTSKAYYELVFAIENHKALLEDLNRAKALLAENRRRVELGVLSPLDVTQAEAGVAEREEAVIIAERTIKNQENVLKRLVLRDVSEFQGAALVPVDPLIVRMVDADVVRSTRAALSSRPDYRRAQLDLDRQHILVAYNRNQLWPELDLQASYGLNGRGGNFSEFVDRTATGDHPGWYVGVTVTIPLGNRSARANYQTAKLQTEQTLLTLKKLEQDIVVQVDNAVGQVQSNLKRVEASRAASRLAEESLKAEVTKLRAGSSTSFLVLQAQSQRAAARSAEIRAEADYNQSLVELARVEGTLLQQQNIRLETKD